MTSDLQVIVDSSSPFVTLFFLHRPIFIGALYRSLDSDILPTLLHMFRKKIGGRA